jgi:hypothetical protein
MIQHLLVGLVSIYSIQVSAGNVEHVNVQYQEGTYSLELEMLIEAKQPDVWNIITDYENLDRINTAIIKSEILQREQNKLKHRLVTNTCILFFCNQVTLVEDIEEINNTSLVTRIDPTQSDFYFGTTEWHLHPEEQNKTRVKYHKQMKPAFWIPPIIGPALVKYKLRTEAENSIRQIEILAADE